MVEQLFTARSERKVKGKEWTEQLLNTRKEKRGGQEDEGAEEEIVLLS